MNMNALRMTHAGLVVLVAGLMVATAVKEATAGIGIGFGGVGGGIGISVGRGGQRPGQRVQSTKKHLRGGQSARQAPRTSSGRTATNQSQPVPTGTKVASPAKATKSVPAKVAAPAKAPQAPLELIDVRLIDIGNVELGEGPRFRVLVKNPSAAKLQSSLEVMISAGISDAFSPELPTAVGAIEPLAPGQVVPVELRLPVESMAMIYPGRKEPFPFSTLFVLVGGPKNMLGSSSITKLKVLPLGDVKLADLAISPLPSRAVPVGLPLELRGEGFGPQVGKVQLTVDGVKIDLDVLGWSELGIAVQMPKLSLTQPKNVQLQVLRADGQPAKPMALTAVLPTEGAVEEVPFPKTAPQEVAGKPTESPEVATTASPEGPAEEDKEPAPAQQSLSLAQAFGGLGLPPAEEKE